MSPIMPAIPTNPRGTLVLYDDEGQVVQYSLTSIEASFQHGLYGDSRVDLSARMAGENFVDIAPKVKTVADLSLGMLNKTRVRITTEEGVHEGVLRAIATETTTTSYGRGHKTYHTDIELGIGNACIPAKTTDLAEVIEEEEA